MLFIPFTWNIKNIPSVHRSSTLTLLTSCCYDISRRLQKCSLQFWGFTCWVNAFDESYWSKVGPYSFFSCWMDTFKGSKHREVGPYSFFTCWMDTFEDCIVQTPPPKGLRSPYNIGRGRGTFLSSSKYLGLALYLKLSLRQSGIKWIKQKISMLIYFV